MLNIKKSVERLTAEIERSEHTGLLEPLNCIFYMLPLTFQLSTKEFNWKHVFSAEKFNPVSDEQGCIDIEFCTNQTVALDTLYGFTTIVKNLSHDSALIEPNARILLSVEGVSEQLPFISAPSIKVSDEIKTLKYRSSLPGIQWEEVSIFIGGSWHSLASTRIRAAIVNLACLLPYDPTNAYSSKLKINTAIKLMSLLYKDTMSGSSNKYF